MDHYTAAMEAKEGAIEAAYLEGAIEAAYLDGARGSYFSWYTLAKQVRRRLLSRKSNPTLGTNP